MRQAGKQKGTKQGESSNTDGELPASLDFFKYAQGGSNNGKRKISETRHHGPGAKKRRMSPDSEDEDDNEGESQPSTEPRPPRHRVTAKGSKVPDHVESFEALQERYGVPSRISSNLSENGYIHPTGIQSYGIPILMEVRLSDLYVSDIYLRRFPLVERPCCHISNGNWKDTFIPAPHHGKPGRACVELSNGFWIRCSSYCCGANP